MPARFRVGERVKSGKHGGPPHLSGKEEDIKLLFISSIKRENILRKTNQTFLLHFLLNGYTNVFFMSVAIILYCTIIECSFQG